LRRVWDLDAAEAHKVAHAHRGVVAHTVDVTQEQAVRDAVTATLRDLPRIDILVNAAGIAGARIPLAECSLAEWQRVLDVNLNGTFLRCREIVRHMRGNGYGRIVDVASIAGKEGNAMAGHYCAAKAAVIAFAKALAEEHLEATSASMIAWMCSEECSFTTGFAFDASGGRGRTSTAVVTSGIAAPMADLTVHAPELELQRVEIAEYPRCRRGEAGDRSRIDEPRRAVPDVGHALDRGNVRMTAAHEVPVARAGQRVAVFGIVHDEDAPSAHLDATVGTVVAQQAVAFVRPAAERHGVAEVVAMDHVHRQADAHRRAQRLRADDVTAMNDGRGALGRTRAHGTRERLGAIVTVRDDADLHHGILAQG
jgi:3-oxoacyl-[acyl-carrier protein] reductase